MRGHFITPSGETYNLFDDMLTRPHLLVAGATGSGKSVAINGILSSALYHMPGDNPGAVSFILIDPKRVELSRYKGIPHVLSYASEPDQIISALRYALTLTESRYKSMQKRGELKYTGGDVYIIIDEFADLVLTQGRIVRPIIQRLAQIGRAARVHIIMATQTPVREVIPTPIKCNFDCRLGLRTRSAQDSRNILDHSGLETLPAYGQGIYMRPEGETLYIIPYVPEAEIARLVEHWRRQTPLLWKILNR